ncbi:MAG: cytochrome c biogenesis CcdA family protein [Candidatus Woesearchaeota archaeon]
MDITILIIFFAGIITFLSPCVLPIIPGFLAYIGALGKKNMFVNTFLYVLGFTIVFALLGVLLSTFFRGTAYTIQTALARTGGIIIILFGLYTLGLFKIGFLERNYNFEIKLKNGYLTSLLFGASFAIGWSPCVGAILGSVFTLAITNPSLGFIYLMIYSLGLGIPFLLIGYFGQKSIGYLDKFKPYLKYFNIVAGLLLITLGILMLTQTIYYLSNFSSLSFLYGFM